MINEDIELLIEDVKVEDEINESRGLLDKTIGNVGLGTGISLIGGSAIKTGIAALAAGSSAGSGTILAGVAIAGIGELIALAGIGYGLYRFFTRISKYQSLVNQYEGAIAKTKDSAEKAKLNEKLIKAKAKLAKSQARAREEKADVIKATQELKSKITQAQKDPNFDKQQLSKMKEKLNARMKLMTKLGVKM